MYGNVSEMTETSPVELRGERRIPRPQDRIFAGYFWDAGSVDSALDSFGFCEMERASADPRRGFRCIALPARP
jgi:hypothetical protein